MKKLLQVDGECYSSFGEPLDDIYKMRYENSDYKKKNQYFNKY